MIHLQILDIENRVLQDRKINRLPCTIGRAGDNDIVINDSSISGHHATLTFQDGMVVLNDMKSSNGLIHQGEKTEHIHSPSKIDCFLGQIRLIATLEDAPVEATQVVRVPVPGALSHQNTPIREHTVGAQAQAVQKRWLKWAGLGTGVFLTALTLLIEDTSWLRVLLGTATTLIGALIVGFFPSLVCRLHAKEWRYFGFVGFVMFTSGAYSIMEATQKIWIFNFGGSEAASTFFSGLLWTLSIATCFWGLFLTFSRVSKQKLAVIGAAIALCLGGYKFLKYKVQTEHKKSDLKLYGSFNNHMTIQIRSFTRERDSMNGLIQEIDRGIAKVK